ncbi:MAG TPA: SpvB/TcaC N-terminal domain-containing protein, partial [Ilumatobacteraceae bacterium]|nr:SpvB/TcaC N-terminal domain-containing protein [Ilumatobacteraceae bacterium]
GIGWTLNLASIRRRTDRGVPNYGDDDTFALAGAEDLVPSVSWKNERWTDDVHTEGPLTIRRYRPRVESEFARIERITESHPVTGPDTWWRVITPTNVTTYYGTSPASRLADPLRAVHVFEWLPAVSFDDQGNCIVYRYKREDLAGVDDRASESLRRAGVAPFTNVYPKAIHYGNLTPCAAQDDEPYRPPPEPDEFLFHLVFDYGEHGADAPELVPPAGRQWTARDDPFSSCRSGFEIRTHRLLKRVLMFHEFAQLDGGQPTLVRSLDLAYVSAAAGSKQPAVLTQLASATQRGYIRRQDGTYSARSMPSVEFDYEPLDWDTTVRAFEAASVAQLPAGVSGPYHWVDLFGEGIAGVLSEHEGAWLYTANLGDPDGTGTVRLDRQRALPSRPSFSGLTSGLLQVQELDADGRKQVVVTTPQQSGYFEIESDAELDADIDESWQPFRPFTDAIRIDLTEAHIRLLDLVGDGRTDILVSDDDAFVWHRSLGRRGYEPARRVMRPADEERGPAVVFTDDRQSVFLADMNGDGLTDIVRIRHGDVSYWPNLGYGRFGARVTMDNAPTFDHPDLYDPRNLRLADISGTGASDLLYFGRETCAAYLNASGNSWSDRIDVASLPSPAPIDVSTSDLLGNGTAAIVWSSSLPTHRDAPLRYIDLMGGRKPHVLREVVNNLGKRTRITYKSSTWFYLGDKRQGRPWVDRLPFPVQCVQRVDVTDSISGSHRTQTFRYRHGRYDVAEREFRGFGLVDQIDAEDFEHWALTGDQLVDRTLHQPPVLTRTWFDTGSDGESITRSIRAERWQAELDRSGLGGAPWAAADEPALPPTRAVPASAIEQAAVERDLPRHRREGSRACRGSMVRQEMFALDAPANGATDDERRRQFTPYRVTTRSSRVTLLQPAFGTQPSVFFTNEAETATWHYERGVADPRVEHTITVAVDDYGHVVESATIAYPRMLADPDLPPTAQNMQGRAFVKYTHDEYTDDRSGPAVHRLPSQSRTTTFEVSGLTRTGPLFVLSDFTRDGFHVLENSTEILPHELDPPPAPSVRRRMLTRRDTVFYDDDLVAPLALHRLGDSGLPFESYELAYTPELLTDTFDGRVTSAMMTDGRYVLREGGWWVPSGRWVYIADGETSDDTRLRFSVPIAHADAFGAVTSIRYLAGTALLRDETVDAAGNRVTIEAFDLRALAPRRMVDANLNVTEVLLDELGRVKAAAQRGKGGEADDLDGLVDVATPADDALIAALLDATTSAEVVTSATALLGHASTRFVYDCDAPRTSAGQRPATAVTIKREQYFAVDPQSPVQVLFEYSNGAGAIEGAKAQAEPGHALRVVVGAGGTATVTDVDTAALVPPQLRWVGSGRRVVNDKGNVVKEYEPFFSVNHRFESARELVETGVTRTYRYDPIGRITRVDQPDGTYSRVEFEPWKTVEWDRNDTVVDSPWYGPRANRQMDAALIAAGKDPVREQQAANHAASHAGTPLTRHYDPLGRPILDTRENGTDDGGETINVRTAYTLGPLGERRSVTDPRGHVAVRYRHDLRGKLVFFSSADGGDRWMLDTVAGEPLHLWDERDRRFEFTYDDPLHRVTSKRVVGGDDIAPLDHVYERIVYGESAVDAQGRNLRTRIERHYDTAGRIVNDRYDLQGNLTQMSRRFATDYRRVPNWQSVDPDAALDAETFVTTQTFDGLNRVQTTTSPDGSVTRQEYNAANLLETVTVTRGVTTEDLVRHIDYNARGERGVVEMGNGITSTYTYDAETFRLQGLRTVRAGGARLQDLSYTYDAVGNLTHVVDACVPTVWFANAMVTGTSTYRYDPLYQLVEATGREHAGQTSFGATDNTSDAAFAKQYDPLDALAWRNYTETFQYDVGGNIARWGHAAAGNDWVRTYQYADDNNRLLSTQVGPTTYAYQSHPEHGFVTAMPHLPLMRWGIRDELVASATQVVNNGLPETTWYVYDSAGVRVRKITDRAAATADDARKRIERYSLGLVEIEREYSVTGVRTRNRSTLHVRDELATMAMVEVDEPDGGAPTRLVRYQCPNHIGSTSLETDELGRVISYEEFHPYGTSAYQAVDRSTVAAAKRYRYTGAERDDETGLEQHGARYYVPWL